MRIHSRVLANLTLLAMLLAGSARAAGPAKPDFGPNVLLFNPSMDAAAMQQSIDRVYGIQKDSQFGSARYALVFAPGEYKVNVPVGYYTQVLGLGASPDAVHIAGDVRSDATLPRNNATCVFWKGVEGFSVTPAGGTMQWAVSQAVPFRRMHIRGDIVLHQNRGWASGGWMSDALIDGNVDSGSQQQWISRNTEWRSWTGSNWNMVFVGVVNPPQGEWPKPPYTKIERVPVVREKPFLQVDAAGAYSVRVPELRKDSSGITWHGGTTPGRNIPLDRFYIARPDADSASTINAQLAKGRNLIFTPGIYDLTDSIQVTRANTVVLGLGFATLRPVNGVKAMTVADVDGVILAGLLFDAGAESSPVLLEVGPAGSKARHAKNPISLHDVFFRVGGAVGRPGRRQPRSQQQRHDHRPHLDLARRSRHRRGLEEQYRRQRSDREWRRCDGLWPVRRALPGIPGAVERQRRTRLLLSIGDSVRSARSAELHERSGH